MKRSMILLLVLGLAVGSMTTADARRTTQRVERTVEGSYDLGPYAPPVTGCKSLQGSWSCMTVRTRPGEHFFTAKVTDLHGRPVFAEVIDDYGYAAIFCGETPHPIRFQAGSKLQIRLGVDWPGQLDCPTNRVKTSGTISVTLSNRR